MAGHRVDSSVHATMDRGTLPVVKTSPGRTKICLAIAPTMKRIQRHRRLRVECLSRRAQIIAAIS